MRRIMILVVEDEPEVREALVRDLEVLENTFRIEWAEDVEEARGLVDELTAADNDLGLVLCDHVLPGTSGVAFLVELTNREASVPARKVLVTGQAGLEDTIQAVNEAKLDYYIAKPWSQDELLRVIRDQLTTFVIARGEDLLAYVKTLDGARILEAVKRDAADA